MGSEGGVMQRQLGRRSVRALLLLVCWTSLCALWLPARQRAPPTSTTPIPRPPLPSDPEIEPRDENLLIDAERHLPSLPLTYWLKHRYEVNKSYKSKDCAPFPSVFDLEYSDMYWQTLRTSQGVFHLYGAYLDARNTSHTGPTVRLLAVHDRIQPKLATYCQLWFEERSGPVVVLILEYVYMWPSVWGNYRDGALLPYLVVCALPADVRALRPAAVSLVEQPCDRATNCLRVHFDEPPDRTQKEFAICVKGLDFQHEDISMRLVEWIELVRLLGADKIFFYEFEVHPNISKVLAYYRARGLVDITPITLPGGQPNFPSLRHIYMKKRLTYKRQMELVPYNDCLYRHMYQYRWLTLLDIDEVIVPMQDPDWKSLLKRVTSLAAPMSGKPPRSSYFARNVYYLDEQEPTLCLETGAPSYMYMLQHVHRTRNFTKPDSNIKAFHETGRVLALHNHFPISCIGGQCSAYPMGTTQARLHHYRANCARELSKEVRAEPVRDAVLWRWADQLVPRVTQALTELGLIRPKPSTNNTSSTHMPANSRSPAQ